MGIVRNSFRAIRHPLLMGFRKYSTDSKVTHIADSKIQQEKLALAQKQGELWECIGRKPDQYRGYLYYYGLKKEYDIKHNPNSHEVATKKFSEIFPALEHPTLEEARASIKPIQKYDLGYDLTGNIVQVPDHEALEARFEKIRTKRPEILAAPLKIASSEGVADHLSFLEAYLKFDVLLSTGREFLHDHFAHVIVTLYLILTCKQYAPERERMRENVKKVHQLIVKAEDFIEQKVQPDKRSYEKSQLLKIKTSAGTMVDRLWTISSIPGFKEIDFDSSSPHFIGGFQGPYWGHFYEKKFGEKWADSNLNNLWNDLKNLETTSRINLKS